MTEDTRPTGGGSPDAEPTPPTPPYAAHLPAAGAYAAYAPAPGAHGPAAGAPSGYAGVPRQEYPGAPPTWGTGPETAPPTPPRSSALAVIALAAGIFGVLIAFVPILGSLFAWLFLLTGLVLAIVSLARRAPRKGMAIAAILVSVAGLLISVAWSLGVLIFGGLWREYSPDGYTDDYSEASPAPEEDYHTDYPMLRAPDFPVDGNTLDDAVAFGTPITLNELDNGGDAALTITVQPLQDVTATASGAPVPDHGAFLVLPLDMTNLTDRDIDLTMDYTFVPSTWLITGDGGTAETDFLPGGGYPTSYEVGIVEPGETVTTYQVFDVAPSVTTTGTAVVQLSSGQTIYWRAAPAA